MTSQPGTSTAGQWWRPVRRLWWVPVVVGLLAGVVVGSAAGADAGRSTSAVLNTRAASSMPNERTDLINDLTSVLKIPAVVDPVAEESGLGSDELRRSLTVAQVDDSTLVRVTLTTDEGDEAYRREVIERFVITAQDFLQPATPSPAFEAAQTTEQAAIDDYYAAIESAGGLDPHDILARLQVRIVEATRDRDLRRVARLRGLVPKAVDDAREFSRLTAARDRASETLLALAESEATASSTGPAALEPTFLDDADDAVTASVVVRRGIAAGIAAAALTVGLLLLLARRRRLRA